MNESLRQRSRTPRRLALHLARVTLLVAIVLLIHRQHRLALERRANATATRLAVTDVTPLLPSAASLSDPTGPHGLQTAHDANGAEVGSVLQTSPESDHIVGFSGPTNVLIVFGPDDRLAGIRILSSGDTREHVNKVAADDRFMHFFDGLTWPEVQNASRVDAVSGATLTSLAIAESVMHRLGGGSPSLKFPEGISVSDVTGLFPQATTVRQDEADAAVWQVFDAQSNEIGTILRTSPAADNIVGYQGPTDTLIGFSSDGDVVGIAVGRSFDNEPYVAYVRDEPYFLNLFNGLNLDSLAELDLKEAQVEGVSGATMTSQAVAESLVTAARQRQQSIQQAAAARAARTIAVSGRDFGTAAVIVAALLIGFTRLRGWKWVRVPFQLVLIGYLGLVNGDLLSQAMFVGWSQSGVPVASAVGLLLLTLAAVLVPVTSRTNLYCCHVCPHGAAQQLVMRRLPWQINLSRRTRRVLSAVPAILLLWVVLVALLHLPFSLVDIEPFDAYLWSIAGWATIAVAIVGLVASLFIPMAYCRYGCPTGAVLEYLRFNARSDRWTRRDTVAVLLFAVAVIIGTGIIG